MSMLHRPSHHILKPEQIIYAEWLSCPASMRKPPTLAELATQLGVTTPTLYNWRKVSEVQQLIDDLLNVKGRELVPEAISVLKKSLDSPNAKVAFEAAKDVLSRWGMISKSGHVIASIKELYDRRKELDEPSYPVHSFNDNINITNTLDPIDNSTLTPEKTLSSDILDIKDTTKPIVINRQNIASKKRIASKNIKALNVNKIASLHQVHKQCHRQSSPINSTNI